MLQVIISVFMIAFCCTAANASTIEIVSGPAALEGELFTPLKSHITIHNTTMISSTFQFIATPISLAEGHEIQVCVGGVDGTCYAPKTTTFTSNASRIAGDETINGDANYLALITTKGDPLEGTESSKPGVSKVNVKFVFDNNPADAASFDVTFTLDSVASVEVWKDVNAVYPNPAKDIINVNLNEAISSAAEVSFFNENGEKVATKQLSAGTSSFSLDVNSLANGSYYFTITSAQTSKLGGKFVIE